MLNDLDCRSCEIEGEEYVQKRNTIIRDSISDLGDNLEHVQFCQNEEEPSNILVDNNSKRKLESDICVEVGIIVDKENRTQIPNTYVSKSDIRGNMNNVQGVKNKDIKPFRDKNEINYGH